MRWILCVAVLLVIPIASAQMQITEVLPDPTQNENYNEWIEIHNTGSEPVDLTDWAVCSKKLASGYVDKASSETKGDQGLILAPNQYAVITDGGSGTEVYVNFQVNSGALSLHVDANSICGGLTNTGDTVTLENTNAEIVSDFIYAASEPGKSINKGGEIGEPTPGAANKAAAPPEENQEQQNDDRNQSQEQPETNTIRIMIETQDSISGAFTSKITLTNKFAEEQILLVTTYVYKGSKCITEGGWSANEQEITLVAGESRTVEFENAIKEGTLEGDYTFKVKAKVGSKAYEATKEVSVKASSPQPEEAEPEEETDPEEIKPIASLASNKDANGTKVTGSVIYEKDSENNVILPLAIWGIVLAITVVMLVIQMKSS